MITRRSCLGSFAALPLLSSASFGQAKYPERSIKVMVPFGPGGLADVTIRVVAEKMSGQMGQQVIVVNLPGPGGINAAKNVLSAAPDGYTLALFTNGTAISVPLVKSLDFNPVTEFTPISALGSFDFVIATAKDQPYKTLADLLAAAKANPGKLNAGTINVGSSQNLSAVLFKAMAGLDFQIIPYRTTPDAITAVLRRDVDFIVDGYAALRGMLLDGQIRALATSGLTRSPISPDVPTVDESGVKGFDVTSWNALFAPAATPPDIVKRLNAEVVAALADETVRKRLLDMGIEARGGKPEEIGDRLKADIAKWGAVIEKAGIPKQ